MEHYMMKRETEMPSHCDHVTSCLGHMASA